MRIIEVKESLLDENIHRLFTNNIRCSAKCPDDVLMGIFQYYCKFKKLSDKQKKCLKKKHNSILETKHLLIYHKFQEFKINFRFDDNFYKAIDGQIAKFTFFTHESHGFIRIVKPFKIEYLKNPSMLLDEDEKDYYLQDIYLLK